MIFQTLTYQNFQSVGNQSITIDLNRSSTTLVGGHNGSGKSTIVEALTYALYGKSLKKVKLAGLINAINKKKMLVSVVFAKNGHTYKVVRGEKPKVFEIWCDGEQYKETAAARDNQAQLEYILGIDFKMFTQVIVLNKERYVPFMDLDAAARRKVVEDVLDISIFSTAAEIVKEQLRTCTTGIQTTQYELTVQTGKKDNLEKLIAESSANNDMLIQQQREIIAEALARVDYITPKVDVEQPQIQADLAHIQSQIKPIKDKKSEFETFRAEFNTKIRQLKSELTACNQQNCPTCKQALPKKFADDHILKLKDQLTQYENSVVECSTEIDSLIGMEQILGQEQQSINNRQSALNALVMEKNECIRRAYAAENMITKLNAVSNVDGYREELLAQVEVIDSINTSLSLQFVNEEQLKIMRDLLKDDGIKSHIISEYLDFLNDRINKYLYAMDFYLNITLDSGFNDTIHNSQYDGFSYENLSTGQKCRVNIAIWLALLEIASIKNSIATNLLFIDEIFENLDQDGVQLVMKLVKSKLNDKNVFVITQRFDEFRDAFHSDLRFCLVEEFTSIA